MDYTVSLTHPAAHVSEHLICGWWRCYGGFTMEAWLAETGHWELTLEGCTFLLQHSVSAS